MKQKRLRIVVRHDRAGGWKIFSAGSPLIWCGAKKSAIKLARGIGRSVWNKGRLAQLVCYRLNGTIEWEATYGQDQRRHKG